MRYLISLILACATLLPIMAEAYDVLIIQSRRDPAYEEVLKGFRSDRKLSERVIALSDYSEVDIARIVREDQPGLVVTLGDSALTATAKVRQTPVIALMALSAHNLNGSRANVAGIGMFVQPEHYMNIFKGMKARRIGIIHNPAKSGWYLRQAQHSAQQAGIDLVVRSVKDPRDTLNQLESLAGKVDALWMLPDTTAVTRDTAEAYFRFSQEQRIPVISFAAAYLGLGAAAVVEIDRFELGRQANDLAMGFLTGNASGVPFEFPQKIFTRSNPSVLKHLGIQTRHFDVSSLENGF